MQQSSTSVAAKKANGQGSVYPKYKKVVDKKSQRYVGAIYDITGKRRKKTFRLKKDAENWVAEQRIIRERGGTSYAVDPKESIENFLNNWVSNRYFNSPETERNYRGAIKTRIVPYIGSVPASKVTTRTLEQLIKTLRDKGYSK